MTLSSRGAAVLATAVALVTLGCGAGIAPAPAPAKLPHSFYGIVSSPGLRSQDFNRMKKAGVAVIRFQLFWPTIQTSAGGPYNWSASDKLVRNAANHGIESLPVLFGDPSFETGCTSRDCSIRLPLKGGTLADWKSFATAAAKRYGPGGEFWTENPTVPAMPVKRWQVWNEVNNFNANHHRRSSPAEYAKLVKATNRAITGAQPKAKIMLCGMFGTPHGSTDNSITAWGFLSGLYRSGLAPYFDYVALHPYAPKVSGITYQIKKIRRVMTHHHDGGTRLIVSELGWGSGPRRESHPLVTTPKGQKRLLAKSFGLLSHHSESWRIGGVYWFSWKDPSGHPTGLCAFCYSSGLNRSNRKPKPALSAYRRFAR
jgi:polysaccharide biosynthesis protein PslG